MTEEPTDTASPETETAVNDTVSPEQATEPKKKRRLFRRIPARQILLIGALFIVGFIVFGVIAIEVWEYSNSVAFCADACHDVHPEEVAAYRDSYHANVKCTECHMGRLGTIRSIFLKTSHARHLPEVIFDSYDRPLRSETMRPANESCELCHWPPAFHGDTVREITRYLPDEQNTEERTYLILKTGAGTRETGLGYGIHWHITNKVEFIATDEHKEVIPWVRATLPDGRIVEYQDVANPLTAEEIESSEKKVIDCVDCHNRLGHPFPSPGELIHQAMTEGKLSTDLPYVKKEMLALLTADYESREQAMQAASEVRQQYEVNYPEAAAAYPDEIKQAQQLAEQFVSRLVFEEPGVTWQSFPDHNKHKDFAGCFRCHDGKHESAEGESIRLHCNICHSIPQTVQGDARPPQMPLAYIQEPESHLATSFMADHRFQASDECTACHGEIEFGDDDSSFCANSACHGRAWPEVDLDANFEHPIELVGKHAETWCHDCHEGVRKPEYKCANCHTPPTPHFGDTCEDCHTPLGFELADMGDFVHPISLEGAHAALSCSDCHVEGPELTGACSDCHVPPTPHFGDTCEDCHTPLGFEGADMGDFVHPVSLEGAHAALSCSDCHVAGSDLAGSCSDCHVPPTPHFGDTCEDCHTPQGFEGADMGDFVHPISLEAAHAVLSCSDCHVAGSELTGSCSDCHVPPTPHFGDTCEDCHTPTRFSEASMAPELHPVELVGNHLQADCTGCHGGGQVLDPFVCSNCHERPENHLAGECDTCHTPAGFVESASSLVSQAPQIEHGVEGLGDCLVCHDPESQIEPAPSNHAEYVKEQCLLCHKPES